MNENNRPDNQKKPAGGGNKNQPPPNGVSRFGRPTIWWMLLIGLVISLYAMLQYRNDTVFKNVTYSTFVQKYREAAVQELTIADTTVRGKFTSEQQIDGQNVTQFETTIPIYFAAAFAEDVLKNPVSSTKITIQNNNNLWMNLLISIVPWVLIIFVIWFFLIRQLRSAGGGAGMLGNFGRSKHRVPSKEHTNVTFEDVAGIEEAKDEVREIVEFLRNPKRFQRLGGRIPRGVLLMGEPGTGKTLLAKAIAGEADVPFFSISGSDFVEMFVGVGASRVRDLFKQAKDNSPCIIFLDEIDAVGRRRGAGFSSGGHDEREQTLNAILVEMDGFDTNDQVIVIAATNRLDVLDPALTRPGRFDRTVTVQLPDVKGRLEILKVHARKVKLGPNVDLTRLARATPGFSGADLAAIINESALAATLQDKEFIEQIDLEESRDKVRFGRARKSRVIDEKEKIATAYHEAGHAVVQYLEKDADPIHKVTIIPRGNYGGATMSLPEKDRHNYSRSWCISHLKTLFAGRIAEEMFTGDVNTGASMDIRQATTIARKMVTDWGMNDRIGFVFYGEDERQQMFDIGGGKDFSEETARAIDEEVKKLIDRLYGETRSMLEMHRDKLDALGKALVKHETLDASDVDRVMRGEFVIRPTVSDLLDETRPPSPRVVNPPPANPDIPPGAIPAT